MTAERDPIPRWVPPALLAALTVLYLWALARPSLWLDEAWEANYYAGFEAAPWYNRPMLYMTAVRAMVHAFGPSELALRLLPCLAGLAAIAVTYRLARRGLGRSGALAAAGLLAFAGPFVRESHQLKHYAFDALFTALLVLSFERWRDTREDRRLVLYAAAAALSFGFSFSSVFVVTALAAIAIASEGFTPARLSRFVAVNAALAVVFVANFVAFHRGGTNDSLLVAYFADAYAPWSAPWGLPLWLGRATVGVVASQSGASSGVAAALLVASGWWSARHRGAAVVSWTLACALAVNAAASAFALYPYGVERLSIYVAPLVAIVAVRGIALCLTPGRLTMPRALAVSALVAALFVPGARVSAGHLARGWVREEIREFVTGLTREAGPGQTLYVAEDALTAFSFYWRRAGRAYPPEGLVMAARFRQDPKLHRPEIERLASEGAPVWSLLTHMPQAESDAIVAMLGERFEHASEHVTGDARLDFWRPRTPAPPGAP